MQRIYRLFVDYSQTPRYGTAQDLMELIDKCHRADIGVILDLVPVHFAVDIAGHVYLAQLELTPKREDIISYFINYSRFSL